MPRAAFYTLGCKLNYSETSTIGEKFINEGFQIVDFNNKAEVYIINTCTVTENADRECRQVVRRALRINPEAFIVVTGCYAQLKAHEISKIEGVDAILGSNEKFQIFDLVKEFKKRELSCIHVTPSQEIDSFFSASSAKEDDRTRAFLKIQDGCDYNCSFCTIPLARGKSRSADPEEILTQFRSLIDSGYKEVILTGVNVGDYASHEGKNLYELLQKLILVNGEFRIRISSIEPNLLSDDIIKLTASTDKICNHFHIPLQSGSSKILKLMQRKYTKNDYEKVINKTVHQINNIGIGVDVIVGFPGETDENFTETYNFLKDLPFTYLHVFTYSERPNTKSINFDGVVDVVDRKQRNKSLRNLSFEKKNAFYNSMLGKEFNVLFEKDITEGFMKGFTSNYIRVKGKYNSSLINSFSKVNILSVDDDECIAEVSTDNFSL